MAISKLRHHQIDSKSPDLQISRFCAALCVLALSATGQAINLTVTPQDIERALAIGRGREAERAAFHAPYLTTLTNNPFVERLEILTEFRRYVLFAEERIDKGSRLDAYSQRLATGAVKPWHDRVSVVAHLRFHPQNTYVDVPPIEITLDGPSAEKALIGVLRDPVMPLPSGVRGERRPILGARAEAVFEASLIGQTQRTVSVKVDGKQVATARVDVARVE